MQMNVRIEVATLDDLPGLTLLFDGYRQFYRMAPDPEGARTFLKERLYRGDSVILVAKTNHELLIGFVQLYPSFSSVRMGSVWILNDLYVQPDQRGQKIGSRLMEETKNHAVRNGCIELHLATEKTNVCARNLYEKLGYVQDHTLMITLHTLSTYLPRTIFLGKTQPKRRVDALTDQVRSLRTYQVEWGGSEQASGVYSAYYGGTDSRTPLELSHPFWTN